MCLEHVRGLLNCDLVAFLSATALTLKTLIIRECYVPRASTDEEYALDAAVHKLSAAEHVTISGDLLSPLTIARKTQQEHGLSGLLTVYRAPKIYSDIGGLARALEGSGWGTVAITWQCDALTETDEALVQDAKDVAKARGLVFHSLYPKSSPVVVRTNIFGSLKDWLNSDCLCRRLLNRMSPISISAHGK